MFPRRQAPAAADGGPCVQALWAAVWPRSPDPVSAAGRIGKMRKKNIETTVVEKYNGTLRDNVSSLVRKTSGFAKIPEYTARLLDIHQSYHNLIKPHQSLKTPTGRKRTPAMKENLTNHQWNWEELLSFKEHLLYPVK